MELFTALPDPSKREKSLDEYRSELDAASPASATPDDLSDVPTPPADATSGPVDSQEPTP